MAMKDFLTYFIKFELIALVVIFIPLACLFMSVQVYAHNFSDDKIVRDIQLMLTQKGIHIGQNKEAIKIDGIYGPKTEAGIKEYERQNNMEETGKPSEDLRSRLYEDVKSLTNNNNTNEDKKLAALAQELNETKENLKNTNEALRTITNNMSDHFINNFNNLITLLLSILAIVVTAFSVWLGWYIPRFQEEIAKNVREAHEKELLYSKCSISARVLTAISAHCLNLYKDIDTDKDNGKHRTLYDSYLEIAKKISAYSYGNAKKLEERGIELATEDKIIIDWSKNNRLFYVTTPFFNKQDDLNKTEIREIYNELNKVYKTCSKDTDDDRWWEFSETLAWAEYNMGYKNISEIKEKIESLINDPNLPDNWKREIRERYKKHKPKHGNIIALSEPT
jgi:hypothetical protein